MVRRALLLSAIVVLSLSAAGCQREAAEAPPDPVVRVVRAAHVADASARNYTGVVRPRTEVAQAFRVGGRIAERLVDVGDTVHAGTVLARLDPTDLSLNVESAEAELSAARSALAQASVEEQRIRSLLKGGHASQAAFDVRTVALDEAKARVERDERALELARNQLGYAVLTSNVDGVVTSVSAEAGQVVQPGQEIVRVARIGGEDNQAQKEVLVGIPESRLGDLKDSVASVSLWAEGDRTYRATVREIAPQADPVTRTYAVRFSLPEADDAVRLGMTATVMLTKGTGQTVTRLPLAAVFNAGDGPGVFVVEPDEKQDNRGILRFQPVGIVRYETGDAIVTGVPAGALVVSMGVRRLQPGERVRPDEREEPRRQSGLALPEAPAGAAGRAVRS